MRPIRICDHHQTSYEISNTCKTSIFVKLHAWNTTSGKISFTV